MSDHTQREIEFFGKMTAASTHEMKNVLAIIRESAGLMEDLMTMAEDAATAHRDTFNRAIKVVNSQIQRGNEISDQLNRFAHSTDKPTDRIDLHAAADHLVRMSHRFARLKQVALKILPPSEPMTVTLSPVRLLMTLFGAIDCCLSVLPPDSEICLNTSKKDTGYMVVISCQGDHDQIGPLFRDLSKSEQLSHLAATAETIGGTIELDADHFAIQLLLPEEAPA